MKAALYVLVCLMGLGNVCAQEVNCGEKQKELSKLVTDGKYKQASELLPLLRKKCASHSEELYLAGITTLKYNVETAAANTKEPIVRDLMKFYDQYDANFPNNKNGNSVQKAMLLYDNKLGTDDEIFGLLNTAFTANPDQFTTANSLFIYFKLYNENYKNKKGNITLDQLLLKYTEVVNAIEKNGFSNANKAVEFNNAKMASKGLIKDQLIPENLIAMAEKNFEANKQNISWLQTTADLLSDKAAASPIFGKIATQLHNLQPSSQSAYHLGNYNLKNKNQKEAVAYFEEAAAKAGQPLQKAKIYYTAAMIVSGYDKAQAKKFINSAIENNPKNGSFHILLAGLYANSVQECGATPLQQKAIYQLAMATAKKAAQADARMKTTAENLQSEYGKYAPTKAEMDEIKKLGNKVKIDCWIDETVTF